jgi:hypothetical protein
MTADCVTYTSTISSDLLERQLPLTDPIVRADQWVIFCTECAEKTKLRWRCQSTKDGKRARTRAPAATANKSTWLFLAQNDHIKDSGQQYRSLRDLNDQQR